ncbi:YggS family pyridoxal phosphate-dependent enzyme [Spongiibacter taiwanensis]|uniref:YggS family pyridoxal phosphate-dependent enzyme n=1 Tax=Spongiibacter taiwanensis TaxID=1748242 RepID=UPI002034C8DB|nr:YggS family pyridoxal phosphate-dependent enzyme [Spongiibacter taiwanensis]USA41571.1 YggS family pyridoxal phosphate-dependent enzyme [Spongiibacter taiwanensis]
MTDATTISKNIAAIRQRIWAAEKESGRQAGSVKLMAVSKTRSAAEIAAVLTEGVNDIGENYLQEALNKQQELAGEAICWHFIGPIQSNKTRQIAEQFDWVHSVDRLKIARRLSEQRPTDLAPLNICLQVNISNEESKSGFAVEAVLADASSIAALPNIRLRGLMAIPAATKDPAAQRASFAAVRTLLAQLKQQLPECPWDTLSMGMSGDMEAAIAEGATIVRIGSDIFGPRQ